MRLYLISQNINNDYDTYDSAVVAAETPAKAQRIHPDYEVYFDLDKWSWFRLWSDGSKHYYDDGECRTWVKAEEINKIEVKYIGEAAEGTKPGVICRSFNAG